MTQPLAELVHVPEPLVITPGHFMILAADGDAETLAAELDGWWGLRAKALPGGRLIVGHPA